MTEEVLAEAIALLIDEDAKNLADDQIVGVLLDLAEDHGFDRWPNG